MKSTSLNLRKVIFISIFLFALIVSPSPTFAASPTATNLSATETYTEDTPLNLIDIVVTDIDSTSVTATLTLSDPTAGTLSTGTSGAVTSTYNAGAGTWTASGPIANVNTLLAGLTFIPTANYNTTFFIATDVSDGVDSPVSGSKFISSIPVNDAPTLDPAKNPVFTPVHKNAPIPSGMMGTQISSLVDLTSIGGGIDNVTDPDSGPPPGIAVIAYDSANLVCYYSINNGTSWLALSGVSSTSARLIAGDSNSRIYCVAGPGISGVFSNAITFRAWDISSGANGSLASATSTGGTTAFSTSTDTATLTVLNSTNTAPVAANDEYTVQHDSPMQNLSVLDNDTDADSEPLQITSILQFASTTGDAVPTSPPIEIGYMPEPGFCGDDQFFYTVIDNHGGSAQATVTIHVVGCDTLTETPTLILPVSSTTYYSNVPFVITFTLSELMMHNSLNLTFVSSTGQSFVLGLKDAGVQTSTFSVNPLGGISSIQEIRLTTSETIPNGTYTITLSYQDASGNPAAIAVATNVTIAQPITIQPTVPGSGKVYGCKDPHAKNYNQFSASDPSLCRYGTQATPVNSCKMGMVTRTLRSGSQGEDVHMLQKFLNCKGFSVATTGAGSPGKETDKFGSATMKAIKSIQKKYGLKVDGIFGLKMNKVVNNE